LPVDSDDRASFRGALGDHPQARLTVFRLMPKPATELRPQMGNQCPTLSPKCPTCCGISLAKRCQNGRLSSGPN